MFSALPYFLFYVPSPPTQPYALATNTDGECSDTDGECTDFDGECSNAAAE